MSRIQEGDPCPDFTLPAEDGSTVSRAELTGRPFVLYFYPKDDTPGCTTEALGFSALSAEFEALGVPVFGVSPDPVRKHARFCEKHGLTVRLLSDEEKSLIGAFGLWVEKSMYGRRYMGVERSTALVAADGTVARFWPSVSVAGHPEAVLEAARELLRSRG